MSCLFNMEIELIPDIRIECLSYMSVGGEVVTAAEACVSLCVYVWTFLRDNMKCSRMHGKHNAVCLG